MPVAKKKSPARIDPAPRPIDGALPYFNVANKEPDREYVWVYKATQDYGVDHYHGLGYRIERYRDGGPRPGLVQIDIETGNPKKEDGSVIESRGNVLMSIEKARYQEIYQSGADGVSGQKAADILERRMVDYSKHEKDSMRGINNRSRDGSEKVSVEFDKGTIASIPVGDEDG